VGQASSLPFLNRRLEGYATSLDLEQLSRTVIDVTSVSRN
jgi:hypothetical protein